MHSGFIYNPSLYRTADAAVVLNLLRQYHDFKSMLDVGCGTGTWLSVAESQLGIADIQGVDASEYDAAQFHIPAANYLQHDLTALLHLHRTFDLVLCLEVAEHLPETAAGTLIKSLAAHGSVVLFSAAIPGQGGQHHINEQWQSYWQQLFATEGYLAIDLIRPHIWHHPDVLPWYKQNLLLYVKKGHLLTVQYDSARQPDLVHPELFVANLCRIEELEQIREKTVVHPPVAFAIKTLIKALIIAPFRKLVKMAKSNV